MIHKHAPAHARWSEASDASYSTSGDGSSEEEPAMGEWNMEDVRRYVQDKGKCVLVLDGFVVDATAYLGEHVCRPLAFGTLIC